MLKFVLSSIVLTFTASAMADQIDSMELADLLVNEKIANCVSELKAKTTSYDLQADDTSVGEITGSRKNKKKISEISYMLVQGGDMIVGEASISVTYKFGAQFGFEEMSAYSIPYVDSCKVKIDTF